MPRLPQPDAATFDLAAVLHALGDPVRLELVRALSAVGELTCAPPGMDVPKSTLSNHWRILREAGLTATVRDGRHRRMSLRRDDLEVRFPGLLAVVLEGAQSAQGPRSLPAPCAHPACSNWTRARTDLAMSLIVAGLRVTRCRARRHGGSLTA
jgi:DNA-binding transcriptional ArsR family regulator